MFSGAIEREHFLEIIKGNIRFYKFYNISFYKFLILILCFSWMLKIAYVLFPRRSMVMLSNFRLISQCLTPTKLHLNSNFQKICIHNWIWKLGRRYLMYVGNLCLEVWTVFQRKVQGCSFVLWDTSDISVWLILKVELNLSTLRRISTLLILEKKLLEKYFIGKYLRF